MVNTWVLVIWNNMYHWETNDTQYNIFIMYWCNEFIISIFKIMLYNNRSFAFSNEVVICVFIITSISYKCVCVKEYYMLLKFRGGSNSIAKYCNTYCTTLWFCNKYCNTFGIFVMSIAIHSRFYNSYCNTFEILQ